MLAPRCKVAPICGCNGYLRPFTVSRTGLTRCLPQGWHFLGGNRASCPASLPQSCLWPWASWAGLGFAGKEASLTCCLAVRWSWLGAGGALSVAELETMGP